MAASGQGGQRNGEERHRHHERREDGHCDGGGRWPCGSSNSVNHSASADFPVTHSCGSGHRHRLHCGPCPMGHTAASLSEFLTTSLELGPQIDTKTKRVSLVYVSPCSDISSHYHLGYGRGSHSFGDQTVTPMQGKEGKHQSHSLTTESCWQCCLTD